MSSKKQRPRLSKSESETEFIALPFEEQLKKVSQTRGSRKIDLIISSPYARSLTRKLTEEEIYLTIKEVGDEDALPLFELTNYKQAQYIYDLEWWSKDELLPDQIVRWLSFMLESNGKKFIEWVRNISSETLVSVFHQLIIVHTFDNIDELSGDMPELYYPTLDNVFYIEIKMPEHQSSIMKILNLLRNRDRTRYYEVVEGGRFQLKFECENEAGNERRSRLAERGFPSFDDALEIYAPLPKTTQKEKLLGDTTPIFLERGTCSPQYVTAVQSGTLFFSKLMKQGLPPDLVDRIRFDLAYLSHKIIVADGRAPDYKGLNHVLKKAFGIVNIGLEILSSGSPAQAQEVLEINYLEHIFRAGYEPIGQLQARIVHLLGNMDQTNQDFWLNFLEAPLSDIVTSLLKGRPTCNLPDRATQMLVEKEFTDYAEVIRATHYVERAELLIGFFKDRCRFGFDIPVNLESLFSQAIVKEVNWVMLLNSMFINFVSGEPVLIQPLSTEQLRVFYEGSFDFVTSPDGIITLNLRTDVVQQFIQTLVDQTLLNGDEIMLFRSILDEALIQLTDQFKVVALTPELMNDFRYFPSLWFKQIHSQ